MPKRKELKKVLVIGSGPIVIGQAAEFDYSGSQACTSLKEEGVKVVLVNSNPATIQTDHEIADIVYIEPLRPGFLAKIVEKEKPDGIIGTMGGQTGLNLTMQLYERGFLKQFGVEVLGTGVNAIETASERGKFADLMHRIDEPVLDSVAANSVEEAVEFAKTHSYPLILRPAYTLGGSGGGVAHDENELAEKMKFGMRLSRIGQVLIEESVIGWGEFEYEVMRDGKGNCITVCNMENIDPMGIHTGESIVVAPSQTLSNDDHQMLRSASLKIISALGIEGGCNIQLALNQETGEYYVIEVNPRLSRSSALASKATGYPIARVAAKIALGYTLDEIPNAITKKTPASFEPALDYVVVKIPRWPFDKMPEADRRIGTQMKSTGEVMAIGRNFEEALQKAVRSWEIKKSSLSDSSFKSLEEILEHIKNATDMRLFAIYAAIKQGVKPEKIAELSGINVWFIDKMKNIFEIEKEIGKAGKRIYKNAGLLTKAKKFGFSDSQIASLVGSQEIEVRRGRKAAGIKPVYKIVDTCAAEFEASTPYYYSTYEDEDEANPKGIRKVIVIGGGPIRIGQGIEFDYCCCHASFALREEGVQSIIINNNPETVSTDFDASDKLYFEPLAFEDVMNVIEKEEPDGVIVQFGGQTSINLAMPLAGEGARILGTGIEGIDIAEDRERFRKLLNELGIPQPRNGTARSFEDAFEVAERIGYPIVVRPSYVIAGRGMQIVYNAEELSRYIREAVDVSGKRPVLIDKYVEDAIECEIDGVSDRKRLFIGGIMEHIEKAGIHSGDASCVTPSINLSREIQKKLVDYSRKIASSLKNIGAINIQFAVQRNKVFVLEANPRASRTIPYLSKATGIPLAKIATKIALGHELDEYVGDTPKLPYFAVKSVVFPFLKLHGTDFVLGPEMKSTGESMGIDKDFGRAYYKALLGANLDIHTGGRVAISLRPDDRKHARSLAKEFSMLGFEILATDGTSKAIGEGIPVGIVKKVSEGEPNMKTKILGGEIDLVINTPKKGRDSMTDGFKIRRSAVEANVPCITSIEAAFGIAEAIKSVKENSLTIEPLGYYMRILKGGRCG
ncbi:MAG: carbamoyl-phosphate synthase large subunit [Candidatus Micrarchaeota archaeon]|nr:carbamoyl-phosphate synthase large subunit [Candidatus Micrarchaeota archaeon]